MESMSKLESSSHCSSPGTDSTSSLEGRVWLACPLPRQSRRKSSNIGCNMSTILLQSRYLNGCWLKWNWFVNWIFFQNQKNVINSNKCSCGLQDSKIHRLLNTRGPSSQSSIDLLLLCCAMKWNGNKCNNTKIEQLFIPLVQSIKHKTDQFCGPNWGSLVLVYKKYWCILK